MEKKKPDLPKDVRCLEQEYKFVYTQESDSCDAGDSGQYLTLKTQNGGGGNYIVIETERWAVDMDEENTVLTIINHFKHYADQGDI